MGSYFQKGEKVIIREKEKRSKLNVYTCGNIKEIKIFNKKEIGGDNYMRQDLEFMDEKHPHFDWFFNYYFTEMNEKLINKIMVKIVEGYKNKKNSNNNIILIFFDSKEKNDEKKRKIQLILENFDQMNKIYKPVIILALKNDKNNEEENSGETEENLFADIIKGNKYNNYYIKKYIETIHYNEDDYSEITRAIYSVYCYFNNIGDIFSILDEMIRGYNFYNSKMINKTKFASTLNILVLGRPGCGKSTLINLLLNKRKAREGIGESITKVVSKYVHEKIPLTFEDTPGFENDNDLKKMIQFLSDSNNIFKRGKNDFHLVLYLINSSNERTFIGEEVALIDFIEKNMKIPIFFVCTRSKNKEHAKDFEEILKMNLWQNFGENTNLVNYIYCCHLLNEKDGVYKSFGIDELLEGIKNYFSKEIAKKENELFNSGKTETNLGKFEIKEEDSIFLPGLKDPIFFENYLNEISSKIIEDYEYLVYLEESKKIKNNEYSKNIDKIIELLIDHLALELNGKSTGNIFYKKNRDEVINNVNNYIQDSTYYGCFSTKTPPEHLKGNIIKDEKIKRAIIITREFGIEAKRQFLNEIRNDSGFEEYLKIIIKNYKDAIQSLTNLNKIIE